MAEKKTKTTRTQKSADETPVATARAVDVDALIEQNRLLREQNERLMEQINQLTLAVVAGREAQKAKVADDRPTVKVENVIGYAIAFEVTDPRTGAKRVVSLQRKGDFAKLFPEQIEEIKERYPHFFGQGYLAAPEYETVSVNVIRDVEEFINSLSLDEVNARVEQITSLPTLYVIFNHIESKRFRHTDEHGNPLTETDTTGKTIFRMEEIPLDPKTMAVALAVQRRIAALQGAKVTFDK